MKGIDPYTLFDEDEVINETSSVTPDRQSSEMLGIDPFTLFDEEDETAATIEDSSAGIKDYARAAGQGLSFGLSDEAEAGYKAGISKLKEVHPALGLIVDALPKHFTLPLVTPYGMTTSQYDENVKEIRDELSAARESDPLKMMAAEVGGALSTGGLGGVRVLASKPVQKGAEWIGKKATSKMAPGGAAEGFTKKITGGAAKLSTVGALGAAESGLYGFGIGEDPKDRLTKAASLAAVGAPISVALGAGGAAISRLIGALPKTKYVISPDTTKTKDLIEFDDIIATRKMLSGDKSKKDIGSFVITGDPTRILKLPEVGKGQTIKMKNDILGNLGALGPGLFNTILHSHTNRDYTE
jgi:hypothetical protein